MMKIKQILRDWTLVIAILAGILGYFACAALPMGASTHAVMLAGVKIVQPALIFVMLFLTFCNISLHDLKPCGWHIWLLLIQAFSFIVLGLVLIAWPDDKWRIVIEGAMICLVCPTATASAVVARKLGGDIAHITTYIILINLVVSVLVPVLVPFVHPNPDIGIASAMLLILGQVFPLLILPLMLAVIVRKLLPGLHKTILSCPDLPFYIWAVSLALAIAVTVRSVVHAQVSMESQFGLVAVSLLACAFQFWIGRRIGAKFNDAVTAGQALGQKNTVFAIWLGYTFFSPVTSLAGGFYSIWHNVVNTWQIYKKDNAKALKDIQRSA